MKTLCRSLSVIFLILLSIHAAGAQSLTFVWDQATDSPTGFNLYASKTAGGQTIGSNPIGNFTGGSTTSGIIPKEAVGWGRWFFVLTAYATDANGTYESGASNEVSIVITPSKPRLQTVTMVLAAPIKGVQSLWAKLSGKHDNLRVRVS